MFKKIHEWYLGHILEGAIAFIPFALAGYPWMGFIFVTAYFLGRERRDHEIKSGLNPVSEWYKGWLPWKWSKDGQLDFYLPTIFWGIVAWILSRFL